MTNHIAQRMQGIEPFHVMDLFAKAKQLEAEGRSIIHMEIGEPDFPTPETIIKAGHQALDLGKTHYTAAIGTVELRKAIANYYASQFSTIISPDQVIVTPGASGALLLLMGVLINAGDEVLMSDPGYPCNRHFVRLFGGTAKSIQVTHETEYQLTADLIEQNWSDATKAVLLASPSNPTGTIIDKVEMGKIISFVQSKQALLMVDEIYQGLVYDADSYTALALDKNIIVINSFSKYFGMTGWRLGWMVIPEVFKNDVDKLAQNIFLAPSSISQFAALSAFTDETNNILQQRKEIFKERRDFLYDHLIKLGFDIKTKAQGAFYLYADVSKFTQNSSQFCLDLLEKSGVAITPGKDFGRFHQDVHVRFAYTTNKNNMEEAVKRIAKFLQA